MDNSNLEFRKIPSLNFLYEVNENGTIFRNVKTKKHLKIYLDMHRTTKGYYVTQARYNKRHKRVFLHQVVAECWLGARPLGLEVDHINQDTRNNHYSNLRYVNHSEQMKNRVLSKRVLDQGKANLMLWTKKKSIGVIIDGQKFPSIKQASQYLSKLHNVSRYTMRYKLTRKHSCIYDHKISYIDAEVRYTRINN